MSRFRTPEVSREQLVLWSQRLDDALPADHPVRMLDLLLRSSAFAETFGAWESEYFLIEGQPPYPPRDLAALYLHGLLNRLRSSRPLESACWNRLDVLWLLSGQYRLRKPTVEPRIGYLKHVLGLRRFLRRGPEKVRAEWTLACTPVNIGVLLRCWQNVRPVL